VRPCVLRWGFWVGAPLSATNFTFVRNVVPPVTFVSSVRLPSSITCFSLCECLVPRIFLLTLEEDPDFVKSALGAGASAYVVKSRLATDLFPAIRAAQVYKLFVSPTLLYQLE
jgi:DNA-binding NarL/FixJ family response regulator